MYFVASILLWDSHKNLMRNNEIGAIGATHNTQWVYLFSLTLKKIVCIFARNGSA